MGVQRCRLLDCGDTSLTIFAPHNSDGIGNMAPLDNGNLTLPPGATVTNLAVQVLADGKADGDKVFYVQLRHPANAVIDDGMGQVTLFQSNESDKTLSLGVRRISQNKMELYLTGMESQTRQIQASSDLKIWQIITNAAGSGWSMPLPKSQQPHRFYKAVSP